MDVPPPAQKARSAGIMDFSKGYDVKYQCITNYKQINQAMTLTIQMRMIIISQHSKIYNMDIAGDLSRFSRELSRHEREPNQSNFEQMQKLQNIFVFS